MTFRKTSHKQHRFFQKSDQNCLPVGRIPGKSLNVVFGHVGAPGPPWGPTWLPDLAPGRSRPLRTLIFGDFKSMFKGFGEDFGWFFVTMSCRNVARVLAISLDFFPQPTSGHGGGDGPQGSWIIRTGPYVWLLSSTMDGGPVPENKTGMAEKELTKNGGCTRITYRARTWAVLEVGAVSG